VALVVGYTGGVLFGLGGKQMIFPVVLALGGFALVVVQLLVRQSASSMAGESSETEVKLIAEGEPDKFSLEGLGKGENSLEPEEASRWLDGLLERHQK